MASGTRFEDTWRDYCKRCEWEGHCRQRTPCEHFQPIDWFEFQIAEVVDDQDMRQAEYLLVIAEFGGDDCIFA